MRKYLLLDGLLSGFSCLWNAFQGDGEGWKTNTGYVDSQSIDRERETETRGMASSVCLLCWMVCWMLVGWVCVAK